MKILVTGGAGFIGSHFIHHLLTLDKGYSIFNLDKLTYAGNLKSLESISESSRYRFVKGDICDKSIVSELFIDFIKALFFLASTSFLIFGKTLEAPKLVIVPETLMILFRFHLSKILSLSIDYFDLLFIFNDF